MRVVVGITFINAGIMHAVESGHCPSFDDFSQCIWFTVVTFGSVGYGDSIDTKNDEKIFDLVSRTNFMEIFLQMFLHVNTQKII